MKLIKIVITLFIFSLFMIPSVFALEIISAKLVSDNNDTIEFFAENKPFVANVEIKLSVDDIQSVIFNISSINNNLRFTNNNYDSLDSSKAICDSLGDNIFNCVFKNKVVRLSSSDILVSARNNINYSDFNFALKKSTATPKVMFIGTNNCFNDKCYVASGRNDMVLKFADSDVGFSRGMIGFRVGAINAHVSNCVDDECSGSVSIQCDDNQVISTALSSYFQSNSVDDLGIPITRASFSLICDSTKPKISNLSVVEARDLGITTISESFTIKAEIYDSTSPEIKMLVVGDSVGSANISGSCLKKDSFFDCTASVKSLVATKGTYSIPVIFSDVAGNEVRDVVEVDLVEVQRDAISNFWTIKSVKQSSESLTIRNMAYNRDIYVEVDLSGNADLISASVDNFKCVPLILNKTGNRGDVSNLKIIKLDREKNKVFLKLTLREAGLTIKPKHRYSDFSSLEYVCGLNFNSKKDGYYYASPELKNFTVKFDLTEGYTLDEHIYDRIEKINKDLEEQNTRLDNLEYSLNMVQSICKGMAGIDSSKEATALSQIALETSIVGAGPAQGLSKITAALDELSATFTKFGATPCEMLACQSSTVDKFYNNTLGLGEVKEDLGVDIISDKLGMSSRELFNPYKSEIIAYATACVPAVVYHWRIKQGIQCNYAECLSSGIAQMGLSVEHCDSNRAYDDCLRTTGNVLYAFPFTSMFTDVASDVQNMLRDPVALLGGAIPLLCKGSDYFGIVSVHGACVVTQTALSLPTHYKRISGLVEQFSLTLGITDTTRDSCTPALSGSLQAIKTSWENDATREGFGYDDLSYAEENVVDYDDVNGASVRCLGTTCFIYESTEPGAKLIGKTLTTKDENDVMGVIVYGPTGMQEGHVYDDNRLNDLENKKVNQLKNIRLNDINNLKMYERNLIYSADEYSGDDISIKQKELNDKITFLESLDFNSQEDVDALLNGREDMLISPEELALYNVLSGSNGVDGLVGVSKNNMNEYFESYSQEHPLAYEYASAAADIRVEKAEQLASETKLRDETKPMRDVIEYVDTKTNYDNVNWDDVLIKTGVTKDEFDAILDDAGVAIDDDPNMRSINKDVEKHIKNKREDWHKRVSQGLKLTYNNFMVKEAERYESISDFAKVREGALGLSTAADIIGIDNREWRDSSAMGKFASHFDYVTEPERVFCDSAFKNRNEPIGSANDVTIKTGGGTRPGAFISARKSTRQSAPNQEDKFLYWVEGGIETQKAGLKYKIFAYDSAGNRYDYTKEIANQAEPITEANKISSFGGYGKAKDFSSEIEYTKMCIYFDDNRPSDYFYSVNIPGKELCQVFVGE